ncbi:MAG: hypothetical protein HQL15_03975 [Candidatus Omnitrophica bacterium]|nr:hypothetical protein [Candidatus Omnitrophota bacterium]
MTIFLIISFSGCAVINHADELIMMGGYSRDKNVQGKLVDQINASYDALLVAINTNKIKNYPDQTAILTNFGEPIAKKTVTIDGLPRDRWLYRNAIPQKAKDKVYLYFDTHGQLMKFTQEKIEW